MIKSIILLASFSVSFHLSGEVQARMNPTSVVNFEWRQGPDHESRMLQIESRILVLKDKIVKNAEYRQLRGDLATLENRKNDLRADLLKKERPTDFDSVFDNKLKDLDSRLSALEAKIK